MDVQTLIKQAGGVGKMATKLGVSHSTICDWQRDRTLPISRLPQISAIFEVPIDELLPVATAPRQRRPVETV